MVVGTPGNTEIHGAKYNYFCLITTIVGIPPFVLNACQGIV